MVDNKEAPIFLRDFFAFKRNPINIDRVEPIEKYYAPFRNRCHELWFH